MAIEPLIDAAQRQLARLVQLKAEQKLTEAEADLRAVITAQLIDILRDAQRAPKAT